MLYLCKILPFFILGIVNETLMKHINRTIMSTSIISVSYNAFRFVLNQHIFYEQDD